MHGQRIHGEFDIHFHFHVPHIPILGGITMQAKGTYTIHVTGTSGGLTLTPSGGPLPDEQVGSAATGGVSASGGTPPYRYVVTAGTLPPGVNLDPNTGQLIGSPTAAGDATIDITASDVNG